MPRRSAPRRPRGCPPARPADRSARPCRRRRPRRARAPAARARARYRWPQGHRRWCAHATPTWTSRRTPSPLARGPARRAWRAPWSLARRWCPRGAPRPCRLRPYTPRWRPPAPLDWAPSYRGWWGSPPSPVWCPAARCRSAPSRLTLRRSRRPAACRAPGCQRCACAAPRARARRRGRSLGCCHHRRWSTSARPRRRPPPVPPTETRALAGLR
mmetsp:Transcript_18405/g.57102  ORF Transcript_18405/g.57102 Transcript_18405/m.57102 type:complete len:214 (-) Transcript_18405:482-1123(-)